MTTYPTTAGLAAFRRSMYYSFRGDRALPRIFGPDRDAASTEQAAWPDELQNGIGYRHPGDRSDRIPFDSERVNARREAAAMRSRAYAAMVAASEVGTCDECGESYDTASSLDHCAECGTCWHHCYGH